MKHRPLRCQAGALCLLLGIGIAAHADDAASLPPPQETRVLLGVGVGAANFPDYPGAGERRTLVVPFPYIVVRSRYLDVDRSQIRGKVLAADRLSLDVDFGGNVSVTSSRDEERRGMPDLDWLGEVGPALRYRLWQGDARGTLDFVVPARVAASVRGLALHHRGWVSEPRFEWRQPTVINNDHVYWDGSLSALFVNRDYAQYYYGVAPQYATAIRPAYAAPGGYAGWSTELGMSWHHGDLVYGAFVEHTSLHGAAFQSSPLVSAANGNSFGLALAWIIQRTP